MNYRVQCRMTGSPEFAVQAGGFETFDAATAWAQDVLEGPGPVTGYLIEVAVDQPGAPPWRRVVKVEVNREPTDRS